MSTLAILLLICSIYISSLLGQDPAEGWLGYAMGVSPGIITFIEAKWIVGQNPIASGAFFSPWFGIETEDNLNLIQPVNPWLGNSWEIYNEYYQWEPENNIDSDEATVNPGDILYGSITYDNTTNSYLMYHSDLTTGWSVNTTIPIQQDNNGNYKSYTIIYFVFEKDADCDQYPPDNKVTFYDINVQYNYKTVNPKWTTSYVDDVCNNRAKIVNENTIEITWDSTMESNHLVKQTVPTWMN